MTQSLVFISYSQNDEEQKNRLLAHLGVLQREGLIEIWNEDQIRAGADWKAEIGQKIIQAKVAILLITADFLNSDFILDETVPTLLQRRKHEGLIIFPIIAKSCAWQAVSWLIQMKVRPSGGQPVWRDSGRHADDELAKIAFEVAQILDDGSGRLLIPPSLPPPPIPDTTPQIIPGSSTDSRSYRWQLAIVVVAIIILIGAFMYFGGFLKPPPPAVVSPQETGVTFTQTPLTPTPTLTPTLEPIPVPHEPQFGEITFALCFDGFATCPPPDRFVEGITEIHAVFEFSGMSKDDIWERVWYLNDQEVLRTKKKAWDDKAEGIFDNPLANNGQPLPVGKWRLELYVNNEMIQSGSFTIETD